jgi:hypothetical protein
MDPAFENLGLLIDSLGKNITIADLDPEIWTVHQRPGGL